MELQQLRAARRAGCRFGSNLLQQESELLDALAQPGHTQLRMEWGPCALRCFSTQEPFNELDELLDSRDPGMSS